MTATCIIPNCRKRAPSGEPFCSNHRDSPADKLKDRAIVAAEYRLHCSPHEWTDDDSEAMARYILALHGPAISRMPSSQAEIERLSPQEPS
jgi:hypothetical protein